MGELAIKHHDGNVGIGDADEQVVKGWDRALMNTGMGCRIKLQVTAEYAYGSQGVSLLSGGCSDAGY